MRKATLGAGLFFSVLLAGPARAQQTDTALAETLYQQGKDLMDAKKFDEACRKFAESQRLDPATGTLLNLAACNEARGKLASAWAQYTDAMVAARRDQREDRVTYARDRITAIEPKLARVTIRVPADAEVDGLEIRLDNVLLGRAAWGVPAPTDAGQHIIEASAPERKTWSQNLQITDADQKTISIPLLENAPRPALPPPGSTSPQPGIPVPPDRGVTERPTPTSVWVLGGATVVVGIGAGVTGALYLDKKSTYDKLNADSGSTPKTRSDARDKAHTLGVVNGALTIGAIVGAAATGLLYFTRPEVKKTSRVSPWLLPGSGGLWVTTDL